MPTHEENITKLREACKIEGRDLVLTDLLLAIVKKRGTPSALRVELDGRIFNRRGAFVGRWDLREPYLAGQSEDLVATLSNYAV